MICQQCLNENKDSARFCTSCGAPLNVEVSINQQPAEENKTISVNSSDTGKDKGDDSQELINVEKKIFLANAGTRFVNFIIDLIAINVIGIIIGMIIGRRMMPSAAGSIGFTNYNIITYFLGFLVSYVYYAVSEGLTGKTLAKYFTRTRVIDKYGEKPDTAKILIRSLCRFIPFEQFSFFSSSAIGWHDKLSETFVMKEE